MDPDSLQQYIQQLEAKVTSLMRLVEISTVLNSTLRLKPLLSTIMDSAAEIVDAEAGSVLLWDAKTQELRFAATNTGKSGERLIGKPVPLEGSIAGTVRTRIFQGNHWLYQVDTLTGLVTVIRQNSGEAAPAEGAAVRLTWRATDMTIRPADGGAA